MLKKNIKNIYFKNIEKAGSTVNPQITRQHLESWREEYIKPSMSGTWRTFHI